MYLIISNLYGDEQWPLMDVTFNVAEHVDLSLYTFAITNSDTIIAIVTDTQYTVWSVNFIIS